jgi:UDP-N-acetylmuramoyl-L-alanyl-D-glutamate--2,6-diaminopimelate ligase
MLTSQLFSSWLDLPLEANRFISELSIDSRHIVDGSLFIALPGSKTDGSKYIQQAIASGAIAILETGDAAHFQMDAEGILRIYLPDLKHIYGQIAARFYDYPSRSVKVIGITGTNGKTSTAYYLATLLNHLNKPCAIMGTLGNGPIDNLTQSINTTSDAITIQRFLSDMLAQGFEYVAMEVSSHALEQGRVVGIEFYAAIYTNLTQDHLDYHQTMEAYGEAKKKLFMYFKPLINIFNVDDEIVRQTMAEVLKSKASAVNSLPEEHKLICAYSLIEFPIASKVDISLRAKILSYTQSGMKVELHLPRGEEIVDIPLIGDFNLSNVLAVLTLLSAMGQEEAAIKQLSVLKPVAGRMQLIASPGKASIVIDYAHTPDALEKVLKALSLYKPQKLWCIFGCGGDRDKTKRPVMGEIASRYADEMILTDDNCRFEDPSLIMVDIVAGLPIGQAYQIIHDR